MTELFKNRDNKMRWTIFFIVAVLFIIVLKLINPNDISEYLKMEVQSNYIKAVLIYIFATALISVVFVMPGVFFAILAGILFEPFSGALYCAAASTLGAMISFIIARYFLKDKLKPLISKNKMLNKYLFLEGEKNSFILLMITRLVPFFPYNLQNFAYGLTDISFISYSFYTFIFILPASFIYTMASSGIIDGSRGFYYLAAALVLFFMMYMVLKFIKRKYMGDDDER